LQELVRIVTFRPLEGEEQPLRDLVMSQAVPINQRFGAIRVWFLEGEAGMAIVSVWPRPDDLEAMRVNPKYVDVLNAIKAKSQGLTDGRYRPVGDFSP
jgi:hypothetical protein